MTDFLAKYYAASELIEYDKELMRKTQEQKTQIEAEKAEIENALCSGSLSVEKITELSKRLPVIEEELDEKSMRWLELSEIES